MKKIIDKQVTFVYSTLSLYLFLQIIWLLVGFNANKEEILLIFDLLCLIYTIFIFIGVLLKKEGKFEKLPSFCMGNMLFGIMSQNIVNIVGGFMLLIMTYRVYKAETTDFNTIILENENQPVPGLITNVVKIDDYYSIEVSYQHNNELYVFNHGRFDYDISETIDEKNLRDITVYIRIDEPDKAYINEDEFMWKLQN
ncbi:MAG: hypothetical protein IJN90_01735 [Bacilli bacterium]|nr:hypothetical protein [Bacilli bacterium]